MIRTLIADDSPTARMLLRELIDNDPDMEVVAEAESGRQAIQLAQKLRPKLVVMDINMPGISGFEAAKEIMKRCPAPIVMVTASTNFNEVDTAMEALRVGALAALQKPPSVFSPEFETVSREILGTLKAMAEVKVLTRREPKPLEVRRPLLPPPSLYGGAKPRIVAIAASTGGPSAVANLLSGFPLGFSLPILVVQHISLGFVDGYGQWLDSKVALPVKVARSGEFLRPGTVYVAPDDRHLGVDGSGYSVLSSSPPIKGFRPSATYLFSSVAKSFGAATIAIILTGMGDDGVTGLEDVVAANGRVFAQDEASCVVFGMPKAAIERGVVAHGTPLEKIAGSVLELTRRAAA